MTSLKVVLLGEGRVGKTSLSARWIHDQFDEGQMPTQAAAFVSKKVVIDGRAVEVAVWDTAGQERFHALGPIYYRSANAAILVFDVTDADSFRRVRNWVAELRQMVGHDIALSIAANKQDLPDRAVPDERSRGFASTVGAAYYRTSAKTGAGIEQAFAETAKAALKHHLSKRDADIRQPGRSRVGQPETLTWDSQQQRKQSSSGCCG